MSVSVVQQVNQLYVYIYPFFIFLMYLFFNWRIIALQNFVVFCHTSTRLSHRYIHVPSLLNLPPISLPIFKRETWIEVKISSVIQ